MQSITLDFVVRTVGERTEDVAIGILQDQLQDSGNVVVIREDSHEKAIARTYEVGVRSSADWLVAMDADVLLFENGLKRLRTQLHQCVADVAVFYPGVFDKLYRMKRWAGLQAYRTIYLASIQEIFDELRRAPALKIEGKTIAEWRRRHEGVVFSRDVFAAHDFWQYYRDLYRKGYLNARRNPGYNTQAKGLWKKWSRQDADYLVLWTAMQDSLREERALSNSILDFQSEELSDRIASIGLSEKPSLTWEAGIEEQINLEVEREKALIGTRRIRNDFFENHSKIERLKSSVRARLGRLGRHG